jgi:hypothetical protein
MSIPPIGSSLNATQVSVLTTPKAAAAPDGDSTALEAAESSKTKLAEVANGGFAPKSTSPVTSPAAAANGGVNKTA